jgi:16S rRNA (cytosine967-C5)-methyltransferase
MPDSSSTAWLLADSARVIEQVAYRGRALDEALEHLRAHPAVSRAALQAISFGTVRWFIRLSRWIEWLAARPAGALHPQVHALLAAGLHQLYFSHHPPYAIGHAVVEAARLLRQPRAAGFVNAILRRFLREQAALEQRALAEPEARYAHPQWLMDRIREDWPQDWERILEAGNQPPPLWLRVNRRQGTAGEYQAMLAGHGMQAATCEYASDALLLAQPVDVRQLPGFDAGRVSVQDAAAQLTVDLLQARPGMRVLDACAAPGGKAAHLLERTPDIGELVVLDRSAERLAQVRENFERLGLLPDAAGAGAQVRMMAADAARIDEWLPADLRGTAPFDHILLDVPCSATGVIRRHPDIKLLRRAADIARLAAGQAALLGALWPLLRPGGRLLYVSCSVLHAENGAVVGAFLHAEPTAREHGLLATLPVGRGPSRGPGMQILPGAAGMDGFYYACLEKH